MRSAKTIFEPESSGCIDSLGDANPRDSTGDDFDPSAVEPAPLRPLPIQPVWIVEDSLPQLQPLTQHGYQNRFG